MSYALRYQLTAPNKEGDTISIDIQEQSYGGSSTNLYLTRFSHRFIPSGDDPFEPIYASELTVGIDITDQLTDIPDFTTTNDRKYYVIVKRNGTAIWYGFILCDNVQINWIGGVRELTFNCVDGLGMLDYILFPESIATNVNSRKSLLYYVYTCLGQIQLPSTPNFFSCISYYASGMSDRGTHTYSEPLSQSYAPLTNFKDSDYKYISCLQVLKNILLSFGAQIRQAAGAWVIMTPNQSAEANFYYTEYDSSGSVVSSGSTNHLKEVQYYPGNTSGLYLVDGTQNKILLKGFNNIKAAMDIVYSQNYFDNWDLKSYAGNDADGWNEITGGTGVGTNATITIVADTSYKYNSFQLDRGTKTNGYARVANVNCPKIPYNSSLKFAMTFLSQDLSLVRGNIYMSITDGVSTYYLGSDLLWSTVSSSVYVVPQFNGGNYINDISFTTPPAPVGGTLSFYFEVSSTTGANATVGNFRLGIVGTYRRVEIEASTTANQQYTKTIELPMGVYPYDATNNAANGVLSDSSGVPLTGWYRYGKTEGLTSLCELILQQYVNQYRKNIINVNGNLYSGAGWRFDTICTFTDTDPSAISVSSKYFLPGSVEHDFINNETNGIYLEITDVEITATKVVKYYFTGSESFISYNP